MFLSFLVHRKGVSLLILFKKSTPCIFFFLGVWLPIWPRWKLTNRAKKAQESGSWVADEGPQAAAAQFHTMQQKSHLPTAAAPEDAAGHSGSAGVFAASNKPSQERTTLLLHDLGVARNRKQERKER